jgi:hypothetical protein
MCLIENDVRRCYVGDINGWLLCLNAYNVRILCLSCNVKKVGKLVRFKQKGQKQASFLAFHKCCQGCLLRGPRYEFHACLRPPQYIATGYQERVFTMCRIILLQVTS